jgi:hypothetical protein
MRFHTVISALLACLSAPLIAQANDGTSLTADEVIARMFTHDVERETAAGGYTGIRQYDFVNHQLDKRAQMVASVASDPDGTTHFQIVSKEGWSLGNDSLRQAMDSESQISRPSVRPMTLVTKDNYAFQMIGTTLLNDRTAYVIDVVPKRQETYLFRGRIWVDAEDYALARIEGQLAKSPSYWIRRVRFTLEYRKNGAYWFPWLGTSACDVRILGTTEVNIRFVDYSPLSASGGKRSGLSPTEARYVKH